MPCSLPTLDCREETEEGQKVENGNWDELPQEVLNMIFNHLPVADLLSCSFMSKNWKKASRDVLKRSRECYVHINDFPQDLYALNDIIASQGPMQMFNGLHIKISTKYDGHANWDWDHKFSCSYAENVLQSKQTRQNLERAKQKFKAVLCGEWNYLNLDMRQYWGGILSIDDALLLRELISATSESLQKLVVAKYVDCAFMSCCGKTFTKLQVLQTQDDGTTEGYLKSYLEEFVLKFAPNLEEITGGMLHVKAHHPGDSFMLKRMKCISVADDLVIPEAGMMEGFRHVSDLHRLNLQIHGCKISDDVSILHTTVLKSLKTLEELLIRTSEFYDLFTTSDDMKLPNLRRLSLYVYHMPVEDVISVLRRLNLAKMCPNLENLQLTQARFYEYYEDEDGYTLDGLYGLDRSDTPMKIEFDCLQGIYNHEYLVFLSQIYPKINKVKVLDWEPGDNYEIPNDIFSDIHDLEYLEINVDSGRDPFYALDVPGIAAVLYGINFEEAKELFIGPPKNNSKLHQCIIPTRPTVFNAKNLKKLKFVCGRNRSKDFGSPSWVIRITENLPVRHERELNVTFQGSRSEEVYRKLNDLPAVKTLLRAQVIEN